MTRKDRVAGGRWLVEEEKGKGNGRTKYVCEYVFMTHVHAYLYYSGHFSLPVFLLSRESRVYS